VVLRHVETSLCRAPQAKVICTTRSEISANDYCLLIHQIIKNDKSSSLFGRSVHPE